MNHQERQSRSSEKKKYMEPIEADKTKLKKELKDEELENINELTFTNPKKKVFI